MERERSGGRIFLAVLGKKEDDDYVVNHWFQTSHFVAVLGRNGRRRGSRGGRTRPARPSYLVRQMQIYLVFIFGETNTNIFDIYTW